MYQAKNTILSLIGNHSMAIPHMFFQSLSLFDDLFRLIYCLPFGLDNFVVSIFYEQ